MDTISPCPNCGRSNLYESGEISAGGGYAPNYLPGLGGFLTSGKFILVMCQDCGLTRFFASPEARSRLSESSKWKRI